MDTSEKITDLNAGWYNVVTQALNLNPMTFMLAQGSLGLDTSDSSGLFIMSDAVPPSASVFFDAGGTSKRSSAYRLLLNSLLPEAGTDLAQVLGDMYANWLSCRNGWWIANPTSTLTQEQLFNQWADRTLDPRKAASAKTTFKQAANTPLNRALDTLNDKAVTQQFIASDQTYYSLYRYSATNDAAQTVIVNGSSVDNIKYDSLNANTTLKHTTAQGAATGFWKIFSGSASGEFDQLNSTAASSQLTITGRIGKYGTLKVSPFSWFESGEYNRAYNSRNDNTIWDPRATSGDWNSFFAQPNGSLARKVSQLVLVSDYELTVTSQAKYSSEDCQKISTKASFGIWPFFSGSTAATHTSRFTYNEDKSFTVVHKLNKGLIQIWGVNVLPAPE
jgi:hypothetical protein